MCDNKGKLEFNLADHLNVSYLVSVIDELKFHGRNTNTSGGLRLVQKRLMNEKGVTEKMSTIQ